ncbi:MAG: hypothetical protein ACYDEG_06535 [bacterium]
MIGSEKQIPWAETIRQQFLSCLSLNAERALSGFKDVSAADITVVVDSFTAETSAHWWIDNGRISADDSLSWNYIVRNRAKSLHNDNKPVDIPRNEAEIEATVRPENPKTETVATIKALEDTVEVLFFEKRDDFREIIKNSGFSWKNGSWERKITIITGASKDRAAEVGNILLLNRFIIRIYDSEIREMAINGRYEQECKCWILRENSSIYPGWFRIFWGYYDDKLYKAARKITGSKWYNSAVIVPPELFEEVLDFAERYEFKLSKNAVKVVEGARIAKESELIAVPSKPQKKLCLKIERPELKYEEFNINETLRDDD